jgi:DNA-directed RNA polymerase subunit M/transcription elongation factor TFIIS
MRLNELPQKCPGCKNQVNPYVIDKTAIINKPRKLLVECPNCTTRWNIEDEIAKNSS